MVIADDRSKRMLPLQHSYYVTISVKISIMRAVIRFTSQKSANFIKLCSPQLFINKVANQELL
jgi:hypothetical protein